MKRSVLILILILMVTILTSCGSSSSGGCNYEGSGDRVMFFSANWDSSIMITDDLLSIPNGDSAIPRAIVGANTNIDAHDMDNLFVNHVKKEIYFADSNTGDILVFANAKNADGDIAPSRTISFGAEYASGLEMDVCNDILYVTGNTASGSERHIWAFNDASTLDGTVVPDVALSAYPGAYALSLDDERDILYVGGDFNEEIYIFNGASALTDASTPDATLSWTEGGTGFDGPTHIWADEKSDRLYIGSDNATPDGNYLVALDDASTLTTAAIDLDADSSMRIDSEASSIMIDPLDNLYFWPDGSVGVQIYHDASLLTGDVVASPDLTISDVTTGGNGLSYMLY